MTILSLLSFLACGDKSITDTTDSGNVNEPSSSSPTDDPIIEEEVEPLEAIAMGFEYFGSWDQTNRTLGGWTYDSGEDTDGYVLVHITNIDYFSEGAGNDNENICTMFATFVNQSAQLNTQLYPWESPPTNASQYPLDGTAADNFGGFEGYLTFTGFSADTIDSCGRITDQNILVPNGDGTLSVSPVIEGMHFGISFGLLTEEQRDRLESIYVDSDAEGLEDYLADNINAFVTEFIHINHGDSSSEDGYDFTGYDWNYANLAKLNNDGTIGSIPCSWDESRECYDLVSESYDGAQNIFVASNAFWYEDFPNMDFDILKLGVPDMTTEDPTEDPTPAELFCELFTGTCGDWAADTDCITWYNMADAGTEGDATGATQACYDYHLAVAASMEEQSMIDAHCAHAIGEADADGSAPCQ